MVPFSASSMSSYASCRVSAPSTPKSCRLLCSPSRPGRCWIYRTDALIRLAVLVKLAFTIATHSSLASLRLLPLHKPGFNFGDDVLQLGRLGGDLSLRGISRVIQERVEDVRIHPRLSVEDVGDQRPCLLCREGHPDEEQGNTGRVGPHLPADLLADDRLQQGA